MYTSCNIQDNGRSLQCDCVFAHGFLFSKHKIKCCRCDKASSRRRNFAKTFMNRAYFSFNYYARSLSSRQFVSQFVFFLLISYWSDPISRNKDATITEIIRNVNSFSYKTCVTFVDKNNFVEFFPY